MDKNISNKAKIKNDIILAVVIIFVATAGLLLINAFKTTGDYVSVKINGEEKYTYSLNEDIDTVIYTGENNEGMNRLIIKDGKAYVLEANCPDKLCTKYKPVNNDNESIVCLPHKVVVEIVGNGDSSQPDVVV